jgi:hypothetical protein
VSLLLDILLDQPASDDLDDIIYLLLRERPTFRDAVPFGQTAPAAGSGCMLSDKNRVIPHRRLFAVVCGFSIGQPFGYEITGMLEDYYQTFIPQIFCFFAGEPKSAAKFRPPQCSKKLIHITHK